MNLWGICFFGGICVLGLGCGVVGIVATAMDLIKGIDK